MRALLVMALVACGGHRDPPPARTGSNAGSGSAHVAIADAGTPPVALGSDGLPVSCAEWRAALAKLDACTAFPDNARASLKAEYASVSKDWAQLPSDAKKRLGPICQSGAESILNGAKATCGW